MEELRSALINGYYKFGNDYKYLDSPLLVKFHRWGDEPIYEEEKYFSRTFAIVEDEETGKVYTVDPKHIQFVKF